jgi:hypothetical protein
MNPQERAVIDGIFERLRNVANQPRDAEVERYIADLIRQQPYAPYAMAQSIYVQEQALLNQQQQIEQLQADNTRLQQQAQATPAPQAGGFLSGLFGGAAQPQRPPAGQEPAYGQRNREMAAAPAAPGPWGGQNQPAPAAGPWAQQPPAQPQRQGMGFLGTAAAAAAGVAGGMMLGNILSSAMGGGGAHAAANPAQTPASGQAAQQGSDSAPQQASHDDQGYDNGADYGFDDGGGDSYDV